MVIIVRAGTAVVDVQISIDSLHRTFELLVDAEELKKPLSINRISVPAEMGTHSTKAIPLSVPPFHPMMERSP
jgi:hypothetical protein